MRNLAANTLTVLAVLGIVLLVAIGVARQQVKAPGPLTEETVVTLPRGATATAASEILARAGVIDHPMLFRLAARYSGQAAKLKFGEFRIPAGASIEEVLALLVAGANVQHKITVAEGLTSWEVVQLLGKSDLLTGEITEVPPEGALAPETYFVIKGQDRSELLARMRALQSERLAAAWERRAENLPLGSPQEALILASIVEKETGIGEERPQVASVFINRLRRGMRLQSDPTVVYGVTKGEGPLGRGLKRSELDRATPYNTYIIDRLPPTPIANPGIESIEAVVNPAETNFLYFVADGTGGHVFSATLKEHNRNVARWRKIERAKNKKN